MSVIALGCRRSGSKTLVCSGCAKTLEYFQEDIRLVGSFGYLDCPRKKCKHENYLGTLPRSDPKEG